MICIISDNVGAFTPFQPLRIDNLAVSKMWEITTLYGEGIECNFKDNNAIPGDDDCFVPVISIINPSTWDHNALSLGQNQSIWISVPVFPHSLQQLEEAPGNIFAIRCRVGYHLNDIFCCISPKLVLFVDVCIRQSDFSQFCGVYSFPNSCSHASMDWVFIHIFFSWSLEYISDIPLCLSEFV